MTGRCLCGAVGFEAIGEATPIEMCHCPRCRRAYGGAFAATLYVRADGFRWTSGEELVGIYDAPIVIAPPPYRHVFCSRCGSPLPIVDDALGVVEIPAGVIDGDPGVRPLRHVLTGRRAPWFEPSDDLPRHPEHVPPSEHLVAVLLRARRAR